jgi:uncharacterized protein HemY
VETGDAAQGIRLLQQAIEAHALAAPSYYYLGMAMSKEGHDSEAADWLEKSLASQPSDFIRRNDWYALARVYQKLNKSQDARHALDEFMKLKAATAPDNSDAHAP